MIIDPKTLENASRARHEVSFANFNEKKQEILLANVPRVCEEISSSQHLWRNTAFFFGIILLLLPKWTDT